MTWRLARPSFWPEPRDPWAWQRTLRLLDAASPVPDPWPCWEAHLKGSLSRRSVPGLYGLRRAPAPPTVLGMGLLEQNSERWHLSEVGQELVSLDREAYQHRLAELLVTHSPWVRLGLRRLASGSWKLSRGAGPLSRGRQIRVGEDLSVPEPSLEELPEPTLLLGALDTGEVSKVTTRVPLNAMSALHAPLYLLWTRGWLTGDGRPELPDSLAASLALESPAAALRRICDAEVDGGGFVPLALVAERLRSSLGASTANGARSDTLAAWTDQVFGKAIEDGTIEVHAWGPGQPRHGRGLYGDRDRKLVRWTVHDDLQIPSHAGAPTSEVQR